MCDPLSERRVGGEEIARDAGALAGVLLSELLQQALAG
jgi:hypothetical protein